MVANRFARSPIRAAVWVCGMSNTWGCLAAMSVKRRRNALAHLRALLDDTQRKNSRQAAEYTGPDSPYAFRHRLGRATWEADDACDLDHQCVRERPVEP